MERDTEGQGGMEKGSAWHSLATISRTRAKVWLITESIQPRMNQARSQARFEGSLFKIFKKNKKQKPGLGATRGRMSPGRSELRWEEGNVSHRGRDSATLVCLGSREASRCKCVNAAGKS